MFSVAGNGVGNMEGVSGKRKNRRVQVMKHTVGSASIRASKDMSGDVTLNDKSVLWFRSSDVPAVGHTQVLESVGPYKRI